MYVVPDDIAPAGSNAGRSTRATAAIVFFLAEIPDLDDCDYLNCGSGGQIPYGFADKKVSILRKHFGIRNVRTSQLCSTSMEYLDIGETGRDGEGEGAEG